MGIWFEEILMQMLLRHAYDRDPTARTSSTRSPRSPTSAGTPIMFARMTERYGVPAYGATAWTHELGRLFKTIGARPADRSAAQ